MTDRFRRTRVGNKLRQVMTVKGTAGVRCRPLD